MTATVRDDKARAQGESITVRSTRFGEFEVPAATIIEFPRGIIGFPSCRQYIMLEHREPFCWLQSIDEPSLAFVVVDGMGMVEHYDKKVPLMDPHCDFKADDEFAVLLIVTIRPDPHETTANIKAPVFINLRNRCGVQVIYDNPDLVTQFPLFETKENSEK